MKTKDKNEEKTEDWENHNIWKWSNEITERLNNKMNEWKTRPSKLNFCGLIAVSDVSQLNSEEKTELKRKTKKIRWANKRLTLTNRENSVWRFGVFGVFKEHSITPFFGQVFSTHLGVQKQEEAWRNKVRGNYVLVREMSKLILQSIDPHMHMLAHVYEENNS